jgi:hypothetical protein
MDGQTDPASDVELHRSEPEIFTYLDVERDHMVTLKERVPKRLRVPISFLLLAVGIVSIPIAWVLTLGGISAYFNLLGIEKGAISTLEAATVVFVGLCFVGTTYLGYKGFMYFSY